MPRPSRNTDPNRILRFLFTVAAFAILSGCASVDFDYPKESSSALTETGDTWMGRQLAGREEQHPGESGFFPINDGIDALAARLLMADRAERSIDAQYYLISNDVVGHEFMYTLLEAADRGVRVRLLVDDIQTKGYDPGMAALDSHPNFEVRIFNPFAHRTARFTDGITDFSRINRRMHNKSFTVDNQITLIGGRNIAAEYFGARADHNFSDLDVLAIGPVVREVSDMFDNYWNNIRASPIPAFAKTPENTSAELEALRRRLEQSREEIQRTTYAAAVNDRVLEYVEDDEDRFTWAPYELVYDSPDKAQKHLAADAASITTPLIRSLKSAQKEVVIVSPYFVPRKTGINGFLELHARGIDVSIITNSLAANNQSSVHGGYAPSRKPLLEGGVKIFEVRADASVPGSETVAGNEARATLHTKAFAVDRSELFVGSFNFDPRSANINTELGVIIKSPELTTHVVEWLDAQLPVQTYEVFLDEKGRLRWRGIESGEEVVLDKEPQTSWGQRAGASFMTLLPIKGQL